MESTKKSKKELGREPVASSVPFFKKFYIQ